LKAALVPRRNKIEADEKERLRLFRIRQHNQNEELSRLQQQLDRLEQYFESCPEHQRNEAQVDLYFRQIMALEEHEQTLQRAEEEFEVIGLIFYAI
jgi:hypothetical protein